MDVVIWSNGQMYKVIKTRIIQCLCGQCLQWIIKVNIKASNYTNMS